MHSLSGFGAQLERHPLTVTLQKAASPASCLISLTVCTEAVMLSSRLPQSANGGSLGISAQRGPR